MTLEEVIFRLDEIIEREDRENEAFYFPYAGVVGISVRRTGGRGH